MRYDRRMTVARRLVLPLLPALALALGACRGTVPELNGPPEGGISAVLISCRMFLPTGEVRDGSVALNLEGELGNGETYRLPIEPQRALLYDVEPGVYRLGPTRSLFGFHQEQLKIKIEGKTYYAPFPRDIMRKAPIDIRPTHLYALGILEVHVQRFPGRTAEARVTLDDSANARRSLVQNVIRTMMDPKAKNDDRRSAVAWTRALESQLSDIVTESQRGPAYRPGQ
jgi:hypothetical protein